MSVPAKTPVLRGYCTMSRHSGVVSCILKVISVACESVGSCKAVVDWLGGNSVAEHSPTVKGWTTEIIHSFASKSYFILLRLLDLSF